MGWRAGSSLRVSVGRHAVPGFAPGVVDLYSVLLTSAVGAVAYFTALQLLGGVATYQPARSTAERSPSRRRVLYGAAAVSAVVALASLSGGAAFRALGKGAEGIPFVARRLRSLTTGGEPRNYLLKLIDKLRKL